MKDSRHFAKVYLNIRDLEKRIQRGIFVRLFFVGLCFSLYLTADKLGWSAKNLSWYWVLLPISLLPILAMLSFALWPLVRKKTKKEEL